MFSPVCLFVCLSVCEQLPDHNFSCGVMKLTGINCYVKSGNDSFLKGQGQDRAKGQIQLIGYNLASNCHRDFKLGS